MVKITHSLQNGWWEGLVSTEDLQEIAEAKRTEWQETRRHMQGQVASEFGKFAAKLSIVYFCLDKGSCGDEGHKKQNCNSLRLIDRSN